MNRFELDSELPPAVMGRPLTALFAVAGGAARRRSLRTSCATRCGWCRCAGLRERAGRLLRAEEGDQGSTDRLAARGQRVGVLREGVVPSRRHVVAVPGEPGLPQALPVV